MRIWPAVAVTAVTLLQTVPARAERDPRSGAPIPPSEKRKIPSPITDRFYVEGIFYMPAARTTLRIDPRNAAPGVSGTVLSAERDLGLDSRPYQGRMELMFRLRERNRLRVDFQEVDRSADHVLARTLNIGDQSFRANVLTQSAVDWRIFTLTYTYSLYRNDWLEVGTGAAAHLLQAETRVLVPSSRQRQEVSGAGAFPTIPLDVAWRISRRFALTASGQYFSAHVGSFDGWLADIHEDVQYRWAPNFALGAGYTVLRTAVSLHSGNFPGTFALNVKGAEVFFRASF